VGQVTALTIQSGEVVIDHGAIKDFTDAMTMGYTSVRRLCLRDFPLATTWNLPAIQTTGDHKN
jgi:hypothetical protein